MDACVFVLDENANILKSFGRYKDYLDMPETGFSSNLSELLPAGIRNSVELMIKRALSGERSERSSLVLDTASGSKLVDIHGELVDWPEPQPTVLLVIRKSGRNDRHERLIDDLSPQQGTEADELIARLETEIADLRDLLAATNDELNVVNEQMQTTNEELVTANEELQASNEELQSTNEELHTVNAESAERIVELEAAYDDIENLLENAELAILFLDREMRIRRFSNGFKRIIDLVPGDVGRKISTFTTALTIEGTLQMFNDCTWVLQSGKPATRYVELERGGQAFLRVQPYTTKSGIFDGITLKLLDNSDIEQLREEVRKQRDQLESLIESEASGYWDWHIQENYGYLSPRFKAMLGYAENEIDNTPEAWLRTIHPDDVPGAMERFDAHVRSHGEVPYSNEMRYIHKNGSFLWVLSRGHVVEWGAAGEAIRMMGVHIDITAIKRREEEIRAARQFTFMAAHDLMQPANAIAEALGEAAGAAGDRLDAGVAAQLQAAQRSGAQLVARIQALLDYSRLEDSQLSFEMVDLGDCAKAAIDDLAPEIEAHGAVVTVDPLPMASGAPSLLTQVLRNLLDNAITYSDPERTPAIRINTFPAEPGLVGVRVIDNGIGIPREMRQQVFDVFLRLAAGEASGNGLGLSVCQRLIERHGGKIWIEEGDAGGTAVLFTLRAA